MRWRFAAGLSTVSIAAILAGQTSVLIEVGKAGEKGAIAVPDFRGSGAAQQFMGTFNQVLWSDIEQSGLFRMVAKSMYPLNVPQRPEEIRAAAPAPAGRRGQPSAPPVGGLALRDWSGPPVNANYLAIGYTGVQNNQLVLFAWLLNAGQPDLANAQIFGKIYLGSLDEAGARKVAHDFGCDILKQFGAECLAGTKIYFVSDRTGTKEIWSMDYDGSNQKPFTKYRTITTMPAVSPEGSKIAFTSFLRGQPEIVIHSLETGRRLLFVNQRASMNAQPSFTPDGQHVVFSSTAAGGYAQIYIASANGSGLRRLTTARAIDVEPKVNPKTGRDIVFVSGRSGPQQIYRMNIDGADIGRLTTGEGEAANPSWHPGGQLIAFAWTRGFEPGNFNIFVMDVATRQVVQLTHGAGRNENPSWAPDGRHIVFSSKRGRATQIYTMLADGSQVKQLTTQGNNIMPVWSR